MDLCVTAQRSRLVVFPRCQIWQMMEYTWKSLFLHTNFIPWYVRVIESHGLAKSKYSEYLSTQDRGVCRVRGTSHAKSQDYGSRFGNLEAMIHGPAENAILDSIQPSQEM